MVLENFVKGGKSKIEDLNINKFNKTLNNNFEWFKRRALLITKSSQNVTGKTITETSSGNGVKQNKEQQLKLIRIFELL